MADYGIRYEDLDPSLRSMLDGKINMVDVISNTSLGYVDGDILDNVITITYGPVTNIAHIRTFTDIVGSSQILIEYDFFGSSYSLSVISPLLGKPITNLVAGHHTFVKMPNDKMLLLSTNGLAQISGLGASPILLTGTAIFAGPSGRVITHDLNINPATYKVFITPNENGGGSIGEYHIDKALNAFNVINTGDAPNKTFAYIMTL